MVSDDDEETLLDDDSDDDNGDNDGDEKSQTERRIVISERSDGELDSKQHYQDIDRLLGNPDRGEMKWRWHETGKLCSR